MGGKIPQPVGVIGAGSFGTAIAQLLSYNCEVLLYTRHEEQAKKISQHHENMGVTLSDRIVATSNIRELAQQCTLLFPVVPSLNFRVMMKQLGPYLRPYHILIHGTKGLDVSADLLTDSTALTRSMVSTMSEVITHESVVVRVGCLSGPNLAKEIIDGQPTATVIASRFQEVIELGQAVLSSKHFHVFGSKDILGAELAGALKNVIAIGSGILWGKGYGKNIQAILITRGLTEMIYFGEKMGAENKAFLGTAGIGDLIATATSKDSRNFTLGFRLGQGESLKHVSDTMPELAEGVRTLKIAHQLSKYFKLRVPIVDMLYKIVFEQFEIDKAIDFLMVYPYDVDVDFL